MSQCSYVHVKHTGTAELTQSVRPPARLRLLRAVTAPCPGPAARAAAGAEPLPPDGPAPEGLRPQLASEGQ